MDSTNKPSDPSDRQLHITRAAAICFARSGFHGASMQDICAEAGMSAGALYRYFPSKAAIILAIAEAERERHALLFEPLLSASDPLRALQEIGTTFLQAAATGDMLAADVIAEAGRNPEVKEAFDKNALLVHETICRALERGQHLGVIDPDLDIPAACQLLMSLGDGLCAQRCAAPGVGLDRVIAAMDLLLNRFLRPRSA